MRKRDAEFVRVPVSVLAALTSTLVGFVSGRGSRGRRQEIALGVSRLVLAHADDLGVGGALAITTALARVLNADTPHDNGRIREWVVDPETGALCWSPISLARALDWVRDDSDPGALSLASRRLTTWRSTAPHPALGKGPPWIKLGDASSDRVVYPIAEALRWLEGREQATLAEFSPVPAVGGQR